MKDRYEHFMYHHPSIDQAVRVILVPLAVAYLQLRHDHAGSIGTLTRSAFLEAAWNGKRPWYVDLTQRLVPTVDQAEIEKEVTRGVNIYNMRRSMLGGQNV